MWYGEEVILLPKTLLETEQRFAKSFTTWLSRICFQKHSKEFAEINPGSSTSTSVSLT